MTAKSVNIVSVIDCGSSSVRCSVAQAGQDDWKIIEDVERPLELLPAIQGGRFSRANMDDLVRACGDVLELSRSYGATKVRAVASPSLRDVVNCDVLFERVNVGIGLKVELINGSEEGRLYHQALQWVLRREQHQLPGDVLLVDLGSSTSSVTWIKDGKLVQTLEEHVGSDRLAYSFGKQRDADDLPFCLDRVAHGANRVMLSRLGTVTDSGAQFGSVLVTGKEPRALRRRLIGDGNSLLPEVTRKQLDDTFNALSRMRPDERNEWAGKAAHRFPAMLGALAFMRQLCVETGVERVSVPELQLRIGLLMDFLPGASGPYRLPRAQLVAAAEQLARRYGMNLNYARNTAHLALQIFDETTPIHQLKGRARVLLEFASLVHDIGAHINVRGRHKHTYYILKNADIGGLNAAEIEVVAQTARYHRGKVPQIAHDDFRTLGRSDRTMVSYLAAILRVAYALDVERTQRIKKLRCSIEGDRFRIIVDTQNVAVERWAMARKAELFRSVFGLQVTILPERN